MTLENAVGGWRKFFEDAGYTGDANPCNHKDVKDTLAVLKVVMGSARGRLPDIITPEVALRLLGILDAYNLRDMTIAMMIAQGATMGERAGTKGLRDNGHMAYSHLGVAIHIYYSKTDRTCEGHDAGVMHSETCVPGGLALVVDEDGVTRLDLSHFCAACLHKYQAELLLATFPELTREDIARQPLYADWMKASDVGAGLTVVKAAESNIGRKGSGIQFQEGVFVISRDQEKAGVLYRGEKLSLLSSTLALALVGYPIPQPFMMGYCAGDYVAGESDDEADADADGDDDRAGPVRRTGDSGAAAGDLLGGVVHAASAPPTEHLSPGGASPMEASLAAEPAALPGSTAAALRGDANAPAASTLPASHGAAGGSEREAEPAGAACASRTAAKRKSRREAFRSRGAAFEVPYGLGKGKSLFCRAWAVVRGMLTLARACGSRACACGCRAGA
jgi:hypothetical protein